jgi:hypothetical protein
MQRTQAELLARGLNLGRFVAHPLQPRRPLGCPSVRNREVRLYDEPSQGGRSHYNRGHHGHVGSSRAEEAEGEGLP